MLINKVDKAEHIEEEKREVKGWQSFDKDSVDSSSKREANLDDSLELMKEEELLRKTGCFNI